MAKNVKLVQYHRDTTKSQTVILNSVFTVKVTNSCQRCKPHKNRSSLPHVIVMATQKCETIFVPHTVEVLLNACHTQHFSVIGLNSFEGLLLTSPHITLVL